MRTIRALCVAVLVAGAALGIGRSLCAVKAAAGSGSGVACGGGSAATAGSWSITPAAGTRGSVAEGA